MTANELEHTYMYGIERRRFDGTLTGLRDNIDPDNTPSWYLPLAGHDQPNSAVVQVMEMQTRTPTINPANLHNAELYDWTAIDDPMDEASPPTDGAVHGERWPDSMSARYDDIVPPMVPGDQSDEYSSLGDIDSTAAMTSSFGTASHNRRSSVDSDAETLHVDTDDGCDGVYMFNCHESSWSHSLEAEDDPTVQASIPHQALLCISTLRRAQYVADCEKAGIEQERAKQYGNVDDRFDTHMSGEQPMHHSQERNSFSRFQADLYDEIPSVLLQQVRQTLQGSATITVQYHYAADDPQTCTYPDCPECAQSIKDDTYYIALWPGNGEQNHPFCLRCFEDLWDGVMSQESRQLSYTELSPQWINNESADVSFEHDKSYDSMRQEAEIDLRKAENETVFRDLAFDGSSNNSEPVTTTGYNLHQASTPVPLARTALRRRVNLTLPPISKTFSNAASLPVNDSKHERPSTPPREQDSSVDQLSNLLSTPPHNKHASAFSDESPHRVRATRSSEAKTGFQETQVHVPQSPSAHSKVNSLSLTSVRSSIVVPKVANSNTVHAPRKHSISTDALCRELALAKLRLCYIRTRCKTVLPRLVPGKRIELRPMAAKTGASKTISMDAFGVIYTDLLEQSTTQKWSPHVWEVADMFIQRRERRRSSQMSRSGLMRTTTSKSKADMPAEVGPEAFLAVEPKPLYCSCYGPDDGSPMIICANKQCLVGKYHVRCAVGNGVDHDKGEWYCDLCSVATGPKCKLLLTPAKIDAVFAPPYAGKTYLL